MIEVQSGDIGLVRLPMEGDALFGGVVGPSGKWAVKARAGLIMVLSGRADAVWRLPPPEDEAAREAALRRHLRAMAERPFIYGDCDCALAVADWVRTATGVDPASSLRGAYDNEAGWQLRVAAAGGLVQLFDTLARRSGLERV